MRLIGRIVCFFKGHKRGRLISDMPLGEHSAQTRMRAFQCPRCGHETRYKVKQT